VPRGGREGIFGGDAIPEVNPMKRIVPVLVVLLCGLVTAPALAGRKKTDEKIAALEARVEKLEKALAELQASLEGRMAELEKKLAAQPARPAASGKAPAAGVRNQEAATKLKQAREALGRDDLARARELLQELRRNYADTPAGRRAISLLAQVNVVGKQAPAIAPKVVRWFRGQDRFHPEKAKATIVVFWEVWCPHCRREVPKLQALYDRYHDRGLEIIGLTRLTHGKTPADVEAFLDQQHVTYPVAQEKGELASFFAVRGIPAAAVIRDGKVVWRNHPARITDEMVESWLR